MAAKKRTTKQIPAGARKRRGGFPCPDCAFVAKHAMGLGRHRSTRHGVVSEREKRRGSSGAWVTREQAAARAGVHYNTIRQWERAGLLRRQKRPGMRGAVISLADLNRLLAERAAGGAVAPAAGDGVAVAALEARFTQLVEGLESLLSTLKAGSTRRPAANGRRRGAKKPAAKKSAKKRSTAKKSAKKRGRKKTGTAKRRAPKKRSTAKRATRKRATRKRAARR